MLVQLRQTIALLILMATTTTSMASQASDTEQPHEGRELRCLAQNVYFEARGEPTAGQLAVAMVTMNRVYSEQYPDTICKVVWQRRQFSWTHDGKPDTPDDRKSWRMAKQIAEFVYKKYQDHHLRTKGAVDLTKGALYYYAPKLANPHWAPLKEVTTQIGSHVFLKSRS
ncbi:MAG: cell wall hydrolase [Gammaproteobacteria bacterium]|nr:cell wall hydrolase [Gammaproteobacteria bacterium]